MCSRSRAGIDIEGDTEILERLLDNAMIAVNHILRSDAFFLRSQRDRHSVFIRSTNHQNLFSLQTKIACINIGRHIHSGQMTDVHRPVRIRQRRSNQCSLKLFFHTLCSLFEAQR